MGVRILLGDGIGDSTGACLYCSVSMWAFGPVFKDHDQAQAFLDWVDDDPRKFSEIELRARYHMFLQREEDAA